jgi:hypothetical protein
MASGTADLISPQEEPVLRNCVEALSRVAAYHLPHVLDERLLWLSEHKEQLDATQRDELFALVELADSRSLDKVQAQAVLQQLAKLYPNLMGNGHDAHS